MDAAKKPYNNLQRITMTKDFRRQVSCINKLIYFLSFTLNLSFLLPCGLSRANQLLFLLILIMKATPALDVLQTAVFAGITCAQNIFCTIV